MRAWLRPDYDEPDTNAKRKRRTLTKFPSLTLRVMMMRPGAELARFVNNTGLRLPG